ncbi:hypothetical protein T492DRAFT_922255 [Pavlovales sp. CCMP2436]|nr:hypothetical protein T492DRAFT_922255 [Pavlovales sp. CCMP2436]
MGSLRTAAPCAYPQGERGERAGARPALERGRLSEARTSQPLAQSSLHADSQRESAQCLRQASADTPENHPSVRCRCRLKEVRAVGRAGTRQRGGSTGAKTAPLPPRPARARQSSVRALPPPSRPGVHPLLGASVNYLIGFRRCSRVIRYC